MRGLGLITSDKPDAVRLLGMPTDRITVSDVAFAELDVSCFVTPHVALSVSGSCPVSHDAFIDGTTSGTFEQMLLTARATVHVWPNARVRPYLSTGIVIAPISDVEITARGVGRFIFDRPRIGPVGQLGADIKLTKQPFVNVHVPYALLTTTLTP